MTRVALVASSFLPRFGGVEEHVLKVARGLRDRGYEVTIWAVDQNDEVPDAVDGTPVRYLPCPLPAREAASIGRFLRAAPSAIKAWRRAFKADRPQILNVQCFGPNGVYATTMARIRGVPLVYSAHGETFMDADRIFTSSMLLRRVLGAAIQRSAAITACSQYAADDLAKFVATPPSVEVVFNGVDPAPGKPGTMPSLPKRFIAAVGRLVPNKGFGELIDSFALLTDEEDDVDLVIAGDGPDRRRLQAMVEERGLANSVTLVGRLSPAQVAEMLHKAQMLVVPSHVEAFGITILEGWRAGVPVIATIHGGAPEFVEHSVNGLLVDPFDTATLSTAMLSLLRDQPRADRIGQAGQAAVVPFTWDTVADRYQVVLDGVLHARPPRRRRL